MTGQLNLSSRAFEYTDRKKYVLRQRMIRTLAFFTSFLILASPQAVAKPLVAELFVSKNCEACPAAINVMNQKASMLGDDMLLLTWSVDYWDYLGTADPMAMPEAKIRQRAYAENMSIRGPYTPQVVFNGVTHCPGNREKAVDREMIEHNHEDADLIDAVYDEVSEQVVLTRLNAEGDLSVSLVEYKTVETGKQTLTNAVVRQTPLGSWSGGTVNYPVSCTESCAILVQEPEFGEILRAVRLQPGTSTYRLSSEPTKGE